MKSALQVDPPITLTPTTGAPLGPHSVFGGISDCQQTGCRVALWCWNLYYR